MTSRWMVGASLMAFAVGTAQAKAAEPAAAEAGAPVTAATDGLADIVVTATKTATTVQKTPQAISTVAGETLVRLGIATAQDLNKVVPGLQIEQNGSTSSIFIRGVGSRVLNPSSDPAVAFSVDGIYYSRASGTSATFFDLARIEVVKGPQGTLYGRNATGGAVNVVTRKPEIGVRSLEGQVEVGNYDAIRSTAAVNLPLGDTLALRLAGQTVYNSGYLSDGYNDTDLESVRASLKYEPAGSLSIYLSGDYAAQGGQGAGTVPIGPSTNGTTLPGRYVVPGSPFTGPSDPRVNAFLAAAVPVMRLPIPGAGIACVAAPTVPPAGIPANPAGTPARLLCGNPLGVAPILGDGFLDNEFYGANATVEADLGFARLTALGGYRATRTDTRQRVDYGRQDLTTDTDQYSAEVRLASPPGDSRLKWLVGAFYLREDQESVSVIDSNNQAIGTPATVCSGPFDPDGPGPAPAVRSPCVAQVTLLQQSFTTADPNQRNTTYAGFGQATFAATDWLRLTGGIRYTHERKEADGTITLQYVIPAGLSRSYPSRGQVKFNDTSYRAGIEADLAPRSMAYAHYSTAFHAGGFNLGVEQGPNTYAYQPEKVKSYVVGIKNRFFDNRLQLNVEGFWLDYGNYQQQQLGFINDGSQTCSVLGIRPTCPLALRTDNAAKARIRGAEADVVLKIGDTGTFDANILYNDAKFRRFDAVNPFSGAITSFAGARLPGANTVTISAGYTQSIPLAGGAAIVASARSQYRNGGYAWYVRTPAMYQEAYTRTDLTLGYEARDQRWSVTGFVRNLEDKATLLQGGPTNATTGVVWTNLNPPRTYGAILGFRF